MEYCEDEFLQLSGIQHFCFCRRQWALIHIENQWQENVRTIEGNIVHERCHDDGFIEKRGNLLITRSLSIFSRRLGVSGQCDVVEFSTKDSLRFYNLGAKYNTKIEHFGTKTSYDPEGVLMF